MVVPLNWLYHLLLISHFLLHAAALPARPAHCYIANKQNNIWQYPMFSKSTFLISAYWPECWIVKIWEEQRFDSMVQVTSRGKIHLEITNQAPKPCIRSMRLLHLSSSSPERSSFCTALVVHAVSGQLQENLFLVVPAWDSAIFLET